MVLGYESVVDIARSRLPLSNIGFVLSAARLTRKKLILKLALSNALMVILQVFTRILSLCLSGVAELMYDIAIESKVYKNNEERIRVDQMSRV